jgi:hypothetical protein
MDKAQGADGMRGGSAPRGQAARDEVKGKEAAKTYVTKNKNFSDRFRSLRWPRIGVLGCITYGRVRGEGGVGGGIACWCSVVCLGPRVPQPPDAGL